MIEAVALLLLGLVLLIWSADKLVFGSAAIARNIGISPLVIGMTIIAMGSSAPEMLVSLSAALSGKTDTAVGNVLGSNIANIALILGLTALIKPLMVSSGVIRRELPLMLGITLFSGAILWDSKFARFEGVLLLTLFIGFLIIMLRISKDGEKEQPKDPLIEEQEAEIPEEKNNLKAAMWVVVGLVLLIFSADLVVDNAVVIAKAFGMSDLVIGLTIIAVGTSLPELAASVTGALKGEDDLAVGNIIGSNIFNLLAVMGIPALVSPTELNPLAMERDFYIMLALSVLLFIFAIGKTRSINRLEGSILLLSFVAYQGYLFYSTAAV